MKRPAVFSLIAISIAVGAAGAHMLDLGGHSALACFTLAVSVLGLLRGLAALSIGPTP